MGLKGIARWLGRQVGKMLHVAYRVGARLMWFVLLFLLLLAGISLTFLGNLALLFLGFIGSVLLYLLKGFVWLTEHFMLTSAWFGEQVMEFSDNFYQGVQGIFKDEEEFFNQEVVVTIKPKK